GECARRGSGRRQRQDGDGCHARGRTRRGRYRHAEWYQSPRRDHGIHDGRDDAYEALKAATVNPAQSLGLDAGTIEPGKLADIVIVAGNPLDDVANAHKVKRVVANGRVYDATELIGGGASRSNSARR